MTWQAQSATIAQGWKEVGRPRLPTSPRSDGSVGGGHPKGEEAPPGALTADRGESRTAPSPPVRANTSQRLRNA